VSRKPWVRWTLVALLVLGVILVPFALWEEPLKAWTEHQLRPSGSPVLLALVLATLLALDVVLPVPSSVVSTAAGSLLGLWPGALVSTLGMTLGSLVGYGLGRTLEAPTLRRFVGDKELERMRTASLRWGDWLIFLFRPVPVLAEASLFFAGAARIPLKRFVVLSVLANLGVSLAYTTVGALAHQTSSFLLAFLGACSLPLLAKLILARRL
jgi:uncharacterized membrane protein YdjX (TVP38/TMEM64 family)